MSEDKLRFCIDYINPNHPLLDNGKLNVRHYRIPSSAGHEGAESVLTVILSFGAKLISLYRGNVTDGKLSDWSTPMIVDEDDWFTEDWLNSLLNKQRHTNKFKVPQEPIEDSISVTSRINNIDADLKPIADFVISYSHWNLHEDEWNQPTAEVPLFRVLDALVQRGKNYCGG